MRWTEYDHNTDAMPWTVTMSSEEFGAEEFKYDSMNEALEGIKRLHESVLKLDDGIIRKFYIGPLELNPEAITEGV